MSQTIRAHFDGKVFVPAEAVNMTPGQAVDVLPASNGSLPAGLPEGPKTAEEQLRRLRELAGSFTAPVLPDEAFTRESIYEDRW